MCYRLVMDEPHMTVMSLHDILIAWQADRIDYREAMDRAQIDTLDELYAAATHSGVQIRTEPNDHELRQAEIVADLIRGQARLKAA